ncbi:MAG TPA: hypothetical protein VI248_16480 [Kineosporiaceae bacterium]
MAPRRDLPEPMTGRQQPLVLSGPPTALQAVVSVENGGARRLVVRGITVHRDGADPVLAQAVGVVAPGATTAMPLTASLPATTPPGDYPAEVEVAGSRRPVTLRVEAEWALQLTPRRMLAVPGVQPVQLVVTNLGNVAIPLAPLGRAALRRSDLPDGPPGDPPGPDVALRLDQPDVVEPGATLSLTGTLEVPDGLDPTRRLHARVPIGLADLDVIVLPRATEEPR